MSTEYFIIKPAVGTLETGMAYPAVESYDDYDFNATNSVHKLNYREFPDFEPDIRFKLAKGAKLTDMLSQAAINANGFLINDKLRKVFEKLNSVPIKFYNAKVEHIGAFNDYFWMHIVWPEGNTYVDFTETNFNITEFGNVIESITINSYDELAEKQKLHGVIKMIYAKKIVMRDPYYDIFPNPINTGIIISDKSRYHIESVNPTGVSFIKNNSVLFR
jgi:hypothetical protein